MTNIMLRIGVNLNQFQFFGDKGACNNAIKLKKFREIRMIFNTLYKTKNLYTQGLVVSLNAFSEWYSTLESSKTLNSPDLRLEDLGPTSHIGFEIPVELLQMSEWVKTLQQNQMYHKLSLPKQYAYIPEALQYDIIKAEGSSIYLSALGSIPQGREEWFACMISEISRLTGIQCFTICPEKSSYDQWDLLLAILPEHLILSVENTASNMKNYKTLDEIAKLQNEFPRIHLTFNTANWLALGNSLNDSSTINYFLNKPPHRIRTPILLTTENLPASDSFMSLSRLAPLIPEEAVLDAGFESFLNFINNLEIDSNFTSLGAA